MAHKKILTKQDIAISVNLAVELAPKFAKGLNKPVMPLIMKIATWIQKQYLKNYDERVTTSEANYAVAAAIKSIANMVLYDTIHKLEVDKWVKISNKEIELEYIFKIGVAIIRSSLNKINNHQ